MLNSESRLIIFCFSFIFFAYTYTSRLVLTFSETVPMSTQEQVNASAIQYVLYYIGVDQKDAGVYQTDLSDVCVLAFAEDNTIVCNSWLLGDSYPAPSNATMLSYGPADVLTWYDGYYLHPQEIADSQPVSLTTTKIAAIRTSSAPMQVGYTVYNSTTHKQQRWDGAVWVDLW